jgi:cell division protein FtsW
MLRRNRIKSTFGAPVLYDRWLIIAVLGLIVVGLMMVASSSVMISTKFYHQPFHFLLRQAVYLFAGFVLAVVVMRVDSKLWERYSVHLLFICLVMLLLVLVPGIGRVVNGSRRWLSLGPIGIQVSELARTS